MTHSANDPHNKSPAAWRVLKRMSLRLRWAVWFFGLMGMLDRGPIAREIRRQMAQLEHGLRCLLVIASRNLSLRPRPDGPEDIRRPTPVARGQTYPSDAGSLRFSLSLSKIVESGGRAPQPTHLARAAGGAAHPAHFRFASHGNRTRARIHAIAQVFAATDAHVDRMSRHLARRGYRVRLRIRRPNNRVTAFAPPLPRPAPAHPPAIIDTS